MTSPLRRHVSAATSKARHYAGWQITWIWWQLRLDGDRHRMDLPEGCELVRLGPGDDLTTFLQLPPEERDPVGSDPHERMAHGGTPWLVLNDGRPELTSWTFGSEAPMGVLPSGWVALPEDVAMIEDTVVSRESRGRAIAPAAASAIGDRLAAEGKRTLVTRVKETNAPSNRAVEKLGFTEFARMTLRHNGPRVRLDTRTVSEVTPGVALFVERLDGGRWWTLPHRIASRLGRAA